MKNISLKELSVETAESLNKLNSQVDSLDQELLKRSCQLAETIATKTPVSFLPSAIAQGLEMADDLLVLHCDSHTLAAAIIYPAFHYKALSIEIIQEQLNPIVAKLVSGVQRIQAIHHLSAASAFKNQNNQIDNLRKMSLAIAEDIRIVLIKLAERLSILKHLRKAPLTEQRTEALQIFSIYAPLANRLGIGQFKWQLEDLSFRYLYPEAYNEISKALKMRRSDRESYINHMIHDLKSLLQKADIHKTTITGRAKHIYSIYRKIQSKHVDFSQIFDTSAIRILVPDIKDCYTSLSVVHAEWPHLAQEFDDYIAKPKPNGYRSIHTIIIGPENIHVEIQIRTYQMHEQAELGIAAHWRYKEGGTVKSNYEQKINWLRSVIDWQKEVSGETSAENLFKQTFEDRIYVFTPNGDIFDLEAGATPLDFAYHVHTDIGHRCRGAKVNHVMVPLNHILSTGDQVTILTSKEPHPSRDWLNPDLGYLHTTRAIAKVRIWFKREIQASYLEKGEYLWEKISRREGISKSALDKIYADFNLKTTHDLLIAIGSGDIGINSLLNRLKQPNPSLHKENVIPPVSKKIKTITTNSAKRSSFTIEGLGDLLTQLARCCKPIPGDEIIGYITKGRGVTIHQQDCRNIQYALQNVPERIINVSWVNPEKNIYPVELVIEAENRNDLIRDLSGIFASENIPMLGLNSRVNALTNTTFIHLTLQTKDLLCLRKIMSHLRQLAGVMRVDRI